MQGNLPWDWRCRVGKLPWRVAKVRVTVRATWGAWELVQQNLHSVAGGIEKMSEIMWKKTELGSVYKKGVGILHTNQWDSWAQSRTE